MGSKKRILIFIDWFLPGDKAGGPVRSVANLIDHLGEEFEFRVITRDTDYTEHKPYKEVKSDQWNEAEFGARVYYISHAQLHKPTIAKLLEETEYDHVYLNGMWSQPFTRWPLEWLSKHRKNIPVTIAVRGMLAPSALAIKWFKKKAFLTLAKWKKLYTTATFHATTAQEAKEIRSVFGNDAKIHVAGNLPRDYEHEDFPHPSKEPGKIRLINVARIAPEKNTLFAIESLAHVKAEIEFSIWGARYDHAYAEACVFAAKKLPANIKVHFHGPLHTKEIHRTLAQADLLYLPTRGENFGHVILESMQAGTPVLISDKTPWKNLAEQHAGWDVSIIDPRDSAALIDKVASMTGFELAEWRNGAKEFAHRYSNDEKLIGLSRALFSNRSPSEI